MEMYLYWSLDDFDVYTTIYRYSTKEGKYWSCVSDVLVFNSIRPDLIFCKVLSWEEVLLIKKDVWHNFCYLGQARDRQIFGKHIGCFGSLANICDKNHITLARWPMPTNMVYCKNDYCPGAHINYELAIAVAV